MLVGATAAVADVTVAGSDGGNTIGVSVGATGSSAGSATSGSYGSSTGSQPVCVSMDTGRGLLYLVSCSGVSIGFGGSGLVWSATPPPAAGPGVFTDPTAAAAAAEASIGLPSPWIRLDPMPFSVTGVATWMWIDPSLWHSYSASASVGSVTAVATASPVFVRWDMGDGAVVTCEGPGTPYRSALPAAGQTTSCSHVYRQSSIGQPSSVAGNANDAAFPVTATITWAVSWSSSVAGAGGSLPPLETRSTTALRVEQVQSVDAVH